MLGNLVTLHEFRRRQPTLARAALEAAATRKVEARDVNRDGSDLFDETELLAGAESVNATYPVASVDSAVVQAAPEHREHDLLRR